MTSYRRPSIRLAFRRSERQLQLYFYTSSVEKYLHVKTLLDRFGLPLRYLRRHTEPYPEDYSGTKDQLLRSSWRAVAQAVGSEKLLFIEDTSIRIEALSTDKIDVPGLRAKEWFAKTSFEQLDAELIRRGGDRRASVYSDVALNIPGLGRPLLFHGETLGQVANVPPGFMANAIHPWLTPASFNGWFVPEGATKPLGAMTFEESLSYDFRGKAISDLVDRLEELSAALNLPPTAYGRVRRRAPNSPQRSLLPRRGLLVIGMTCAGKTTFAEIAEQNHNYTFIEASGIVRSLWESDDGSLSLGEFAKRLFEESGSDLIAQNIIDHFGDALSGSFVISGFRLLEEIEVIRQAESEVEVVLVEAAERTRYGRELARGGRKGERSTGTIEEYLLEDQAQWGFGLLRVARDVADTIVTNEGTLAQYANQVEAILSARDADMEGVLHQQPTEDLRTNEIFRCLAILAEADRPLNCGEISAAATASGYGIRANNANKALKAIPELATRLERGPRVRYMITDHGRTYLRLFRGDSGSIRRGRP